MSSVAFERSWIKLRFVERGYSNHPKDRGGPTNYGITEAVARANGYRGDMKDLPIETAKNIAKSQYWNTLRLDDVFPLVGEDVTHELMDTGYNMGIATAGQFLQRTLNVLNREGRDYPDLLVDGLIGPMTLNALAGYMAKRRTQQGQTVLLRALNCLQGARYVDIAEIRPANEAFVYGWFQHRVTI